VFPIGAGWCSYAVLWDKQSGNMTTDSDWVFMSMPLNCRPSISLTDHRHYSSFIPHPVCDDKHSIMGEGMPSGLLHNCSNIAGMNNPFPPPCLGCRVGDRS
jgi:hypothetical protein